MGRLEHWQGVWHCVKAPIQSSETWQKQCRTLVWCCSLSSAETSSSSGRNAVVPKHEQSITKHSLRPALAMYWSFNNRWSFFGFSTVVHFELVPRDGRSTLALMWQNHDVDVMSQVQVLNLNFSKEKVQGYLHVDIFWGMWLEYNGWETWRDKRQMCSFWPQVSTQQSLDKMPFF